MEKSERELLEYAIKMRRRGDAYLNIIGYLERSAASKEVIARIVRNLETLDKFKPSDKTKETQAVSYLKPKVIMGALFIIGAICFTGFLWGRALTTLLIFAIIIWNWNNLRKSEIKSEFFNH